MKTVEAVCVGIGEIGKPLFELVSGVCETIPIDPAKYPENIDIELLCKFMHIAIPGNLTNFCDLVIEYIKKHIPRFVIIHSTVIPGTTNKLNQFCKDYNFNTLVVHSPVNGKHANNQMKRDLLYYTKMVGIPKLENANLKPLYEHFEKIGFKYVIFENPCTTEWAKILSTTYFGMIIAFHQEIERICDVFGLKFEDVIYIFPELKDIRPPHYSGVIGGHCVMPNIELAKKIYNSDLLNWIEKSNQLKGRREV